MVRFNPFLPDPNRNCSSEDLGAFELRLDNGGSNVPVSWSGEVLANHDTVWATLSSSSGTVAAGASNSITVQPKSPHACNLAKFYGAPSGPGKTIDLQIRINYGQSSRTLTAKVYWKPAF